jgi:hypothetical protein
LILSFTAARLLHPTTSSHIKIRKGAVGALRAWAHPSIACATTAAAAAAAAGQLRRRRSSRALRSTDEAPSLLIAARGAALEAITQSLAPPLAPPHDCGGKPAA